MVTGFTRGLEPWVLRIAAKIECLGSKNSSARVLTILQITQSSDFNRNLAFQISLISWVSRSLVSPKTYNYSCSSALAQILYSSLCNFIGRELHP